MLEEREGKWKGKLDLDLNLKLKLKLELNLKLTCNKLEASSVEESVARLLKGAVTNLNAFITAFLLEVGVEEGSLPLLLLLPLPYI